MKAAKFDYIRAENLEHALDALRQAGPDAKLLAGGQSLVPMMAMRLAQPAQLIDIGRVDELKLLNIEADWVDTGAGLRQSELEDNEQLAHHLPLVSQVMPWVGHRQTRNRGTVGGSMVQADPSAELALAAQVLQAQFCLQDQPNGQRWLPAAQFFHSAMITDARDDECLTRIRWPRWQGAKVISAFDEVAIRRGDFAIASAACQAQRDSDGRIERMAFGAGGVGATALAFAELSDGLVGQMPTGAMVRDVAARAAQRTDPGNDIHADAHYRRHLARVLLERVIARALELSDTEVAHD